jgi:ABC-type uncharacterized transport system permease subunit
MPDMHSPIAILLLSLFAGAIRVSTPYLFVSLGECLTEKGGRVNLGLEGILVSGFAQYPLGDGAAARRRSR